MAEFNIKNSKIEQLTNSGNNYKVVNPSVGHTVSEEGKEEDKSMPASATVTDKIFVVHGHDEEMKQAVARTVSSLDLMPIILHEQANEGKTVIEKFETHAEVGFAIVLLSHDDMAYPKSGSQRRQTPSQTERDSRTGILRW